MSNRELKTILSGFSLILFISLYYNISKSTVNTTAENIQAVVSMITLIVSIVTIYFVYKAYQSQNEQIAIQKQELEESRKEIEENKKNVEYNRVLESVYKQLELSLPVIKNKMFREIYHELYFNERQPCQIDDYLQKNRFDISDYIEVVHSHIDSLKLIINQSKIKSEDKKYLKRLVHNNLSSEFFYCFNKLKNSNIFFSYINEFLSRILELEAYKYRPHGLKS